jgi:hypothetical protein
MNYECGRRPIEAGNRCERAPNGGRGPVSGSRLGLMIRTWLRAGVFAAAVTGAVAVALAVGQARRSTAPANGAVSTPAPTEPGPTSRPRPKAAAPPASIESPPPTLDFYSARTKATVAVPLDRVRKRRTVRVGDEGRRQERYAAIAEFEADGRQLRLFKFIGREQFDRLDVPEEEA